jgi:hypothetical protein
MTTSIYGVVRDGLDRYRDIARSLARGRGDAVSASRPNVSSQWPGRKFDAPHEEPPANPIADLDDEISTTDRIDRGTGGALRCAPGSGAKSTGLSAGLALYYRTDSIA